MLRSLIVLSAIVLFACPALAHPPANISADYDGVSQVLEITVDHSTSNPGTHFIKLAEVSMGGKELAVQKFPRQFDNKKQVIKLLIPKLSGDVQFKVKAYCSLSGEKERGITVSIPGYTDVTPAQAQVLYEEIAGLEVIDVSPHYDKGHLPGAKHYYLPELKERLKELKKDKTYLVYCHAEGPSRTGAQTLADNGFSKVYRLKGNYSAWVKAGYKTEK